ncbi:hypothetical protein IT413_04020 [Candidatus Peregrinibacteria bacterium]|nr:hypothetical protein [Candidatus Peregrinibacteria bacterium]
MSGFTPQFVDKFLNPLLKRVMTDMADPSEDKQYLRRLTIGAQSQKLQPLEREKFFRDYFRQDKTKPYSSTEKEDLDFQNEFLDTFISSFDLHKGLSGVDGVKKLYFPEGEKDKEKKFSDEAQRNIYRLAYKLSLTFEKKRIEELMKKEKGEVTEKDKENIALGKVKLIIVDGVERYITEEESKVAAQNPAASKVKVQTFSGEEKTLGELPAGFSEAKAASLEMALEENGLEIIEPIKPDPQNPGKFAMGVVRDVSGQKLNVKIDLDAKSDDPRKMAFTFQESPPGKTNRKGETFTSSLNDLNRFQPSIGERKSAEEVFHPEIGKVAQEKKQSESKPLLQPGGFTKVPPLPPSKKKGDANVEQPEDENQKMSMHVKGGLHGKKPLIPLIPIEGPIPVGKPMKVGVVAPSKKKTEVKIPEGSLIGGPGGNAPTIVEKKKAVADAKAESPEGVLPPQSPFLQHPQGPTAPQQAVAPPKKSKVGKWIVAAHVGTFGGLLGGGAWSAITSDSDAAKKVVVMVLKTIGIA